MKVLFVGEYSRLHNSLKEGLQKLGHEVTIIASGDGFKDYPSDIRIINRYNSGYKLLLKKAIHKVTGFDISSNHIKTQVFKNSEKLKGFDIVQLINESPFLTTPKNEKKIISLLKANNKKLFLLSCGSDFISTNYALKRQLKYSVLTPFFEGKIKEKDFSSVLKYQTKPFENLHKYLYEYIDGVIASDIDYHIPLNKHPKYLGLVPNAINIDKIEYIKPVIKDRIIIFHGINTQNYYKKGNDIFDKALDLIKQKHQEKIEVIQTKDKPYNSYINLYDKAHIVLDQVYAYDQGYNALEAMAKGKVVFTGAEKEWLDYYKLEPNTIAINATPNFENIFEKLDWLIENPYEIQNISRNARNFIEKEHNYLKSAQKFIDLWKG